MEIKRVSPKEYKQIFSTPFSLFNSVDFAELNISKCLAIHYLIFFDGKNRLGIILGETENLLKSPFSATYGGFSYNASVLLQYYDEACVKLKEYGENLGKKIQIVIAPPLYNQRDCAKTLGSLMRAGAIIKWIDYNHHFVLKHFEDYEMRLDSKTRNKLHKALSGGLHFEKLDSSNPQDVERAYGVILSNHIERGNPMHMSLRNILDTISIIPADFFVVATSEGIDIAAAFISHTSKATYQVVYWGDIPSYSNLKSMNFLSYKIFEYYFRIGLNYLDIGISSEYGIPNYGLCEFKENIGCSSTNRFCVCL